MAIARSFRECQCNESLATWVLEDMEILITVAALILLNAAVWRWAADSRDWTVDDRAIRRRPRRAI